MGYTEGLEMDMQVQASTEGIWREMLAPGYAGATATLCLGVGLFAFNGFLVSTALPSAVDALGGAALISWSVSLYLLFAIFGGTIAALLKARWGARNALQAAAVVFTLGTLLAAFAPSMPPLLFGRVLQGFGEGLIAAICYALIPEIFPSRLVPKVFGAEAMVWACAAFGGPVIAGVISETLSWRAAFLVNVPLSLTFMVLVFKVVPRQNERQQAGALPLAQLAAIIAGMLLIMAANVAGGLLAAAALLLLATTLFFAAVYIDRRSVARLFPLEAFKLKGPIGLGLWVVLLMPLAHSASQVYLVYVIQHVWGYGPTLAGTINAAMAMCWSGSAVLVAGSRFRGQRQRLVRLGPLLLVIGLGSIVMSLVSVKVTLLMLGQVLIGIGFGVSWGYLSQGLMEAATEADRNRTSTLLPTLQSAAYAIGSALMGLVGNLAGASSSENSGQFRQAIVVVFLIACAIAIPSLLAALRLSPLLFREQAR